MPEFLEPRLQICIRRVDIDTLMAIQLEQTQISRVIKNAQINGIEKVP
jgi:hypothetical protein